MNLGCVSLGRRGVRTTLAEKTFHLTGAAMACKTVKFVSDRVLISILRDGPTGSCRRLE